jgi:hypothetical protein
MVASGAFLPPQGPPQTSGVWAEGYSARSCWSTSPGGRHRQLAGVRLEPVYAEGLVLVADSQDEVLRRAPDHLVQAAVHGGEGFTAITLPYIHIQCLLYIVSAGAVCCHLPYAAVAGPTVCCVVAAGMGASASRP